MSMSIEDAYGIMKRDRTTDTGRFYGPAGGLPLGTGLLFKSVRFPFFKQTNEKGPYFATLKGLVYILTHECDVDQENIRPFNKDVLICPIMPFDTFCNYVVQEVPEGKRPAFLSALAKRNISRLVYLPEINGHLPHGGVMNMNRICYTQVSAFSFEDAAKIGSVSSFGLQEIDYVITNHILRPKSATLPLTRH